VNNGWSTKPLKEVCDVDKCQGIHSNLPYVGLEHIESHTGRFIGSTEPLAVKSSTFKFSPKHVLYGRLRPYLNKVMLPDFEGHCSTEIFPLKPRPGLLRKFLQYWFLRHATIEQIDATSTGARMPRANMNAVLGFAFPVPPLSEQRRIVGTLDEAFEGVATAKANAEKNVQNARALFQSYLKSVFTQHGPGWERKKLGSITTKIGSGATPRGGEASYKPQGTSLIRSLNVHDLGFRYPNLAHIDDCQADELSNVTVQCCDVLLNITGASVARCCVVPDDVLPARVNQHVSIIRPNHDKLIPEFLHYVLISKPFKQRLLQTGEDGGSTRQAITKAQIQDFTVEYPPTLNEQESIVARLNALLLESQRLADVYERKLASLEALKKSLLHQAFTGNL
jgi:type I restriction enzyme, S subunit